ncbi:hypothetical protein D3C73_1653810 [compost metagenome]
MEALIAGYIPDSTPVITANVIPSGIFFTDIEITIPVVDSPRGIIDVVASSSFTPDMVK